MNSTATVYKQYCYSDNCPLPFNKTREMKKKKKKKKGNTDANRHSRRFQRNLNGTYVSNKEKKGPNSSKLWPIGHPLTFLM